MSNAAIEVKGLSKAYTISHEQQAIGTTTFRDSITRILSRPLELVSGRKLNKEKFWALKDVSLSIEKGDTIGLIGRNGSGKSTMLKILSRIVEPTVGSATLHGRTASLLEVGTGFHPELTGRENIFFNGAILGMGRKEINSKFADIIEFSGVEKFLDTPVKFYSSGMYVRLAFAIAAHLDPDILIVDEVLAVGDAEFQRKSLGKMRDVTQQSDRTVIFVSHSMDAIQSICNKCVWLQDGKVEKFGPTKDVIEAYINQQIDSASVSVAKRTNRRGTGEVKFTHIDIKSSVNKNRKLVLEIEATNNTSTTFSDAKLAIDLYDVAGNHLSNILNYTDGTTLEFKPGKNRIKVEISEVNLVPGSYTINTFLGSDIYNTKIFDWVDGAASFLIEPYDFYGVGTPTSNTGKFLYLDYKIQQQSPVVSNKR